jgi:hypothetical protein
MKAKAPNAFSDTDSNKTAHGITVGFNSLYLIRLFSSSVHLIISANVAAIILHNRLITL